MTDSILFLGDWYTNDSVDAQSVASGQPFIFNLEAPISKHGTPVPNKLVLRMEQNWILECFGHKPVAVCLANNHIADYGDKAIIDTFAELRAIDVPFFGAGNEEDNYNNPLIIEFASYRIAFLGYVCPSTHPIYGSGERLGVAPIELERIRSDIQLAKKRGADRLVVMLHWGFQDTLLPRPEDIKKAHEIIDFGADLIVGHHAHSPQPFERYRGKAIAYGLGNFMFPEIKIPYFDDSSAKEPSKMHKQRQRYWNKVSWGFVWNPEDGKWTTKQYFFDGKRAFHKRFLKPGIRDVSVTTKLYPLRFRIHLSMHRFIWTASDYVRNPARFRPKHVWAAMKMIFKPTRS